MADNRKNDGFFKHVSDFFKRVQNQDITRIGGKGGINILNSPQSKEELKLKQEYQVFRQYLQQKNWNLKHIELFDEFRRMDATFPIINAALTLYSQEVCLSGDCVITTPEGDITILDQYKKNSKFFLVNSYDPKWKRKCWNECLGVKSNGLKQVFEVTVARVIDEETSEWDDIPTAKFKCTDNHKIFVGNNKYKELKDLKLGDLIFCYYDWKDPSCGCKEQRFLQTTILNITPIGEEEVFDLINVSPDHHFTLKLTKSFHIVVHNCNKDAEGTIVKIASPDRNVVTALDECFYRNLKLDSRAYLIVRNMLKFGNGYSFLNTRRGVGVLDLFHLPPETLRIHLIENADRLDAFKYRWYGYGGGLEFEPWEIVHWKIIQDIETEPYGQSILRSIVDTWRRIVLMREALVIYRITRAPQRYLFKIDTTGLDPDSALRYAENMKKQLYKKPLVDPKTGEIDFKFSSISIEENFYLPTQEGDVGGVELLEGANNLDAVEDYKIIKDDLFAGLLIPKSYLTFEEDLSNKAALCLAGETIVNTSEGKISIKDLTENFEKKSNYKVYVLSSDSEGFITYGKVKWCKPTRLTDTIYRVHLNNDKGYVDATDNHEFLLEDLVYVRADELKIGNQLKNIFEKVVYVERVEIIHLNEPKQMYDLEVEKHHNFSLDVGGIFVHNSQEDLRFNNAVKQYQSYFVEGLLHIGLVHLYMNGHSKDELESFELTMNNSSTLAEKVKNELLQQRIDLAKAALDNSTGISVMSYTQVLKDILKFSDEQIAQTFKNQLIEKKLIWRLKQLEENGFYEEPDPDKKKAKMAALGINTDDIFKNLKFESTEQLPGVERILKEQVDKQIEHLSKPVSLKPSKAQVEKVMDLYESKVKRNIKKTFIDLGMNGNV